MGNFSPCVPHKIQSAVYCHVNAILEKRVPFSDKPSKTERKTQFWRRSSLWSLLSSPDQLWHMVLAHYANNIGSQNSQQLFHESYRTLNQHCTQCGHLAKNDGSNVQESAHRIFLNQEALKRIYNWHLNLSCQHDTLWQLEPGTQLLNAKCEAHNSWWRTPALTTWHECIVKCSKMSQTRPSPCHSHTVIVLSTRTANCQWALMTRQAEVEGAMWILWHMAMTH